MHVHTPLIIVLITVFHSTAAGQAVQSGTTIKRSTPCNRFQCCFNSSSMSTNNSQIKLAASMSTTKRMADSTENEFVTLPDGASLPYSTHPSPFPLIVGHGLGSDPSTKSHHNDIATDIVTQTLQLLSPLGQDSIAAFYTARGHGESRSWEKSSLSKFHWSNLAEDMLSVAQSCHFRVFTAMGQSMGAATSLYLAMKHPDVINAIVLMRLPQAWEERKRNIKFYQQRAEELKKQNKGYDYLPILGAADTDLPPRDDPLYQKIKCPVLILSHANDKSHPVSTGEEMKKLIPHADFRLAKDENEARSIWPGILAEWLIKKGLVDAPEEMSN